MPLTVTTNNKRIKSTSFFGWISFHLLSAIGTKTSAAKKNEKNSTPSHEKTATISQEDDEHFGGRRDLIPIMSFSFFLILLFQRSKREKRWGERGATMGYISHNHTHKTTTTFRAEGGRGDGEKRDRKPTAVPIASSSSSITRNPIFLAGHGQDNDIELLLFFFFLVIIFLLVSIFLKEKKKRFWAIGIGSS